MAAVFGRSLVKVALLVVGVLCTGSEAGFGAAPLVAPVATSYLATAHVPTVFPAQGVLRSAYSQVVGRSYAPSFVPVASSLAYAAPPPVATVARAVPTAYFAPQLVAGPVLKTVAAPSALPVPFATPFAAVGAPLTYAAPVGPAFAPAVRAAVAPAIAPAFAPSAVLASRFAPLPAPVAPAAVPLGPAPTASLPGVIDARDATPTGPVTAPLGQRTFLTAFGSPAGIQLVGLPGVDGSALTGVASSVESARVAPAGPQNPAAGRSATPERAASNPETFGVPQQSPFGEYGVPAQSVAPVNP